MTRFLFALVLASTPALRAVEVLDIRLVSEVKAIAPGQPFYVGLALQHEAGYHSYWKFPGIVGVPTSIKWLDLPAGFKAEPIDWPEPEPVKMFQIKAQGYERDVVLPIRITPSADLKPGTQVTLKGRSAWMCCNRNCHPGFTDVSVTIPVAEMASLDAQWHPKFEAERAIRPRTSKAWTASATSKDKAITLTLKPGSGAAALKSNEVARMIFFTLDGMVDSDKPQHFTLQPDGSLTISLVEAEYIVGERPKDITGVLLHPPGWESGGTLRCLEITAPLTD